MSWLCPWCPRSYPTEWHRLYHAWAHLHDLHSCPVNYQGEPNHHYAHCPCGKVFHRCAWVTHIQRHGGLEAHLLDVTFALRSSSDSPAAPAAPASCST